MDEKVRALFEELHELRRYSASGKDLFEQHKTTFLSIALMVSLALCAFAIWKMSGGKWNLATEIIGIVFIVAIVLMEVFYCFALCYPSIAHFFESARKGVKRSLSEIEYNSKVARSLSSHEMTVRLNAEAHLDAIIGDARSVTPSSMAAIVFAAGSVALPCLTFAVPTAKAFPRFSFGVIVVTVTALVVISGGLFLYIARLNRYAHMRDMLVLARNLKTYEDDGVA